MYEGAREAATDAALTAARYARGVVTIYPTKIDWWLRPLFLVPVISGGLSIAFAHDHTTVVVSCAALAAYALLMLTLGWPIHYTVTPEELEVRFGLVRRHIPWDRLISMDYSQNPLSSPAFSLDRLDVRYASTSGRDRSILISPIDRAAFIEDCARTSGRHRVDGGRLIRA
jgi:membrane protein YdbS with pleckstrin-like domain